MLFALGANFLPVPTKTGSFLDLAALSDVTNLAARYLVGTGQDLDLADLPGNRCNICCICSDGLARLQLSFVLSFDAGSNNTSLFLQ